MDERVVLVLMQALLGVLVDLLRSVNKARSGGVSLINSVCYALARTDLLVL